MPRKTDGDKIDELQRLVAEAREQIAGVLRRLDQIEARYDRADQAFQDVRREVAVELAALKAAFDEFRRWAERSDTAALRADLAAVKDAQARADAAREKAGARAWSVVPNVVGAVVNGLIAAGVAYFVARR